MLGVRQKCELIEQSSVARHFNAFNGCQPRESLFERPGILQLLLRSERIRIGMAARIRRPRQITADVRQARLAIARPVAAASSGVRSGASRDRMRPKRSLPLARDKGTARNSPSSAGESHASSGGERNHTITAVTQLNNMCRLW